MMAGAAENFRVSGKESGGDSEDESEILEESPCGRWIKRSEVVDQRDIPCIDCAYLAMDTEEGVEVVWNEIHYPDRKSFRMQEEKLRTAFDHLNQLDHPNIVKLHRHWSDTYNDKPRIVFITEYMSSGSLRLCLRRIKRNVKRLSLPTWKRWCTQILSALNYLHSSTPPIIHGNLTCDTIFIQHNGLVKIGTPAPDVIRYHVQNSFSNKQYIAPEYAASISPAVDVYAFGMCALEMTSLETHNTDDTGLLVTTEYIQKILNNLEDAQQKDFIQKCLHQDPAKRGNIREFLFHPLLFEVHALKLIVAHYIVNTAPHLTDTIIDEQLQHFHGNGCVLAEINRADNPISYKLSDVPASEKLEKLIEDVKDGIYPLTAYPIKKLPPSRSRAISPETFESIKSVTPEPIDIETREIVNMMCSIKPRDDEDDLLMTILLRMDDKMNRQLTCEVSTDDSSERLAQELVHLGFIRENDREKVCSLIDDTLRVFITKPVQQIEAVVDTALSTTTTTTTTNATSS